MTVPPAAGNPPEKAPPKRVRVILDHPDEKPRRRRPAPAPSGGAAKRPRAGRHRKAPARDGWLCLAAQVLSGWSTTLRACVLLVVFGVLIVAIALTTAPALGASLGTVVAGLGALTFWTAQARRAPRPRL